MHGGALSPAAVAARRLSSMLSLSRLLLVHGSIVQPPKSRAALQMNFAEQFLRPLTQMSDQRVAQVSHILLRSGTPLPLADALAVFVEQLELFLRALR